MSTEHNGAIQALAGCLTQGLVAYSEQILAAQPRVFVQQVDTGSVIAVLPQGKHRSVAAPHGDASARAHTGANRVPSLLPRCLFHARPSLACFILNTSLLFRPSPSPINSRRVKSYGCIPRRLNASLLLQTKYTETTRAVHLVSTLTWQCRLQDSLYPHSTHTSSLSGTSSPAR